MLDQLSSEIAVQRLAGPALGWTDGHVLGNGDVGAVVWGGPETVYVGLSKHDVYDLRNDPHGVRWKLTYPQILRRVQKGERDFLMKLGNISNTPPQYPLPVPCGRLGLDVLRGVQAGGWEQELSLQEARCACRTVPTMVGWMWGVKFHQVQMSTIVQARRNVVMIELASDSEHHIAWSYDRNPTPWLEAPRFSVRGVKSGAAGVMEHKLPEGLSYAVSVSCAVGRGSFEASASEHSLRGVIEFGGRKGPAKIILAVASGFDSKRAGRRKPADLAMRLSTALTTRAWPRLVNEHVLWWRDFWSKSQVHCEDVRLDRLWAMGLYALGSATRPDKSPPHLQGIWNQHDLPPWKSDYHFNVNVQESHWPACSSNHPELQEALVRVLLHDWRRELRLFAREQYEAPGLAVPFCADWRGRGIGGWPLAAECCNTAWAAQHVWWQWLHTRDVSRLRKEFFPFLREGCEFYRHILHRREDGLYHIELTHSPEQDWFYADGGRLILFGRDATIDISLLRYLFGATVEAAGILGVKDGFIDACRDIRDHLPPLPVHDGFLIDQAVGFFQGRDDIGYVPRCHRHPSRLVPIFPCEDIGLHSDPAALTLGRRSFEEFRSYGNDNYTGWSLSFQACIAARLGLGKEAEEILLRLAESYSYAGGLLSHDSLRGDYGHNSRKGGVFQTEAMFGATAAINEMLLQHTGGVTRLFPAAPAGRRAQFRDLRAPGGILVSAEWDGRQTVLARLRTEHDIQVRLANPWPGRTALLQSGRAKAAAIKGAVLVWQARKGNEYHLRPKD